MLNLSAAQDVTHNTSFAESSTQGGVRSQGTDQSKEGCQSSRKAERYQKFLMKIKNSQKQTHIFINQTPTVGQQVSIHSKLKNYHTSSQVSKSAIPEMVLRPLITQMKSSSSGQDLADKQPPMRVVSMVASYK